MLKKEKIVSVIPARGGSKRLLDKNIKELCGRPLIEWSIEAAKQSKYIDSIFVSSNNKNILSLAEKQNVKAILRPDYLAEDKSSTVDVLLHTLDQIEDTYDYLVLLQPTSPLRSNLDIDNSIEMLIKRKANSIVSVCQSEHSPLWCNTLPDDRSMDGFLSKSIDGKRSQDLKTYFRLNGAIYIVKISKLIKEKTLIPKNTYAYEMDQFNSIDIDTLYDFICAEAIMKSRL
jgi:CMP-N,N'-diacetyllegionaminic acid synthase